MRNQKQFQINDNQTQNIAKAIINADPDFWNQIRVAYDAYIFDMQAEYPYGDYYQSPGDFGYFISNSQKIVGYDIACAIADQIF